jgi:protein arginine N-methyltransferase 1
VFDVELPEKADVLVGDCRGAFVVSGRNPEIMFHARETFLSANGVVIPERDELFLSLLEWPALHAERELPWTVEGFDWEVCRTDAMSSRFIAPSRTLEGARHLVEPTQWAAIDYAKGTDTAFRGKVSATTLAGVAHFLVLLFKSTTGAHVFGTTPDVDEDVYSPVLLPLATPLPTTDETVEMEVAATPSATDYVFSWSVRGSHGSRRQTSGETAVFLSSLNSKGGRGILRSIGESDDRTP